MSDNSRFPEDKPLILVVDDDAKVLAVLHELFCDDYTVLQASSGQNAIEIVKKHLYVATVVLDYRTNVR